MLCGRGHVSPARNPASANESQLKCPPTGSVAGSFGDFPFEPIDESHCSPVQLCSSPGTTST
jgi:hypothetical protein